MHAIMYETVAVVHAPKVSPKYPFCSFMKIPLKRPKSGFSAGKIRRNGENSRIPPYCGPKNSHFSHIFCRSTNEHQWAQKWCTFPPNNLVLALVYTKRLVRFEKPAVSYIIACTWMGGGDRVVLPISVSLPSPYQAFNLSNQYSL